MATSRIPRITESLARHFSGVHVEIVSERATGEQRSSDHSVVTVRIAGNDYKLDVKSSGLKPPLGWVELTDSAGRKISGPDSELTWTNVARHIKGEPAPAVEQAAPAPAEAPPVLAADLPRLGTPAVFLAFGGRERHAAIVTRVHPDGTVGLNLHPYGNSGTVYHDRIPRHVPGGQLHAWEPVGEDRGKFVMTDNGIEPVAQGAAIEALRAEIEDLRADVAGLRDMLESLTAPAPKAAAKAAAKA